MRIFRQERIGKMGTSSKGKFKTIVITQKTKKDKEGKQDNENIFINIRTKNKRKHILPRDYSNSTRAERKRERPNK
jgi:hypothetical protein